MQESLSLATIPIFEGLAPEVLGPLQAACRAKNLEKGEVLFTQGETGGHMYIIESGTIRIWTSTSDGHELEIAELGQHEVLGELEAIDGKPRAASAQATERTHLFVLPRDALYDTIGKNPGLSLHFMQILSARLRHNNEVQMEERGLDRPSVRLARLLLMMNMPIMVELDKFALILNSHPIAVEELIEKWTQDGALERNEAGHITDIDASKLEELAAWDT